MSSKKAGGFGRRRLEDDDIFDRMVSEELRALYKKTKGDKRKGIAGQPLTEQETRKLESLIRSRQRIDAAKEKNRLSDQLAAHEAAEMTPEQIRTAMRNLAKKEQELDEQEQEGSEQPE